VNVVEKKKKKKMAQIFSGVVEAKRLEYKKRGPKLSGCKPIRMSHSLKNSKEPRHPNKKNKKNTSQKEGGKGGSWFW